MSGHQNFLEKAVCLVMNGKKMIGDEMDQGLSQLKTVAEKKARTPGTSAPDMREFESKDRSAGPRVGALCFVRM